MVSDGGNACKLRPLDFRRILFRTAADASRWSRCGSWRKRLSLAGDVSPWWKTELHNPTPDDVFHCAKPFNWFNKSVNIVWPVSFCLFYFLFFPCWQQFLTLGCFPFTSGFSEFALCRNHICFGEVAHQSGEILWWIMWRSHFFKCMTDVWLPLVGLLQASSHTSSSDREMLLSKGVQHNYNVLFAQCIVFFKYIKDIKLNSKF